MPTVQKMQEQFNKARRSGDVLEGEFALAVMSDVCYCTIADLHRVIARPEFAGESVLHPRRLEYDMQGRP